MAIASTRIRYPCQLCPCLTEMEPGLQVQLASLANTPAHTRFPVTPTRVACSFLLTIVNQLRTCSRIRSSGLDLWTLHDSRPSKSNEKNQLCMIEKSTMYDSRQNKKKRNPDDERRCTPTPLFSALR